MEKKELTAHEKVLIFMYLNKRKFIDARDLSKLTGKLFIGYECSARLSEVAKEYHEFMRKWENGKFNFYKIQWGMLNRKNPKAYRKITKLSKEI